MTNRNKLVAVVGPTASGKTRLAIDIAEALRPAVECEAVNADSRQVYRGMDIGTAKPTPAELAALPHHLLDIAAPDEPFSLGMWLELANEALAGIWSRGRLPLLVGGTGQYVWALLEGWRVPAVPPQEALRKELESRAPESLLEELRAIDPEAHAFIQPGNVRRVVRALEVYHATGKPFSHWRTKDAPPFDWLAVAPEVPRDELYARIDRRVEAMIEAGFIAEVRALLDAGYSCDLPSMSSIGYSDVCAHLRCEISLDEAAACTKTGTHRLARHQNSWFKRGDERIRWVTDAGEAVSHVRAFLQS